MAALDEPTPQTADAENDSAQQAPQPPAAATNEAAEWWRSSGSWWNQGDWRWSSWWGSRWGDQAWRPYERHSYATVGGWGGQSGEQPNYAAGDAAGARHQHRQPGSEARIEGAAAAASSSTSTAATPGGADAATSVDPWTEAARDLLGTARGTRSGDDGASSTGLQGATGPQATVSSNESSDPWHTWRSPGSQWNWNSYGYKGEFSDPPAWPGWSYRRQWTQAIKRWNKLTDIPVFRRSEKVLRTLGWELQADFEHLTEAQLGSSDYLDLILQVIEMKAGVQEDAEKRAAYRAVLSETGRKRDETLAQYAMRRQRDFSRASGFGLELPAELRMSLLREGAGLSEQNQQNLTTLLRGRELDVDYLALLLARMDARVERVSGFATQDQPEGAGEVYLCEQGPGNDDSEDGSQDEFDESDVQALEDLNFSEDQACYVFAILDGRADRRRRTWKENKNYKAEMKKDRGSFVKGVSGDHPRGATGGLPGARDYKPKPSKHGKPRLSREQLKKISRCRLCDRKGHWAEDCHLSRPSSSQTVTTQKPTGFCYLGPSSSSEAPSGWVFMAGCLSMAEQLKAEAWNFLTFRSGEAILRHWRDPRYYWAAGHGGFGSYSELCGAPVS